MKHKRKNLAVISLLTAALSAFTLAGCTNAEPPEETDSLPEETTAAVITETAAATSMEQRQAAGKTEDGENPGETVRIFGESYPLTADYVTLDMNLAEEGSDVGGLALLPNLRHVRIENADSHNLGFLEGLELDSLAVLGSKKTAKEQLPALSGCAFSYLYFESSGNGAQTDEDSDVLFKAFPQREIRVAENSSKWYERSRPTPLAVFSDREVYGEGSIALHITNNDTANRSNWLIFNVWAENIKGERQSLAQGDSMAVDESIAYENTLDISVDIPAYAPGRYRLCFQACPFDNVDEPREGVKAEIFYSDFFVCSPFDEMTQSERSVHITHVRHKTPDFLDEARTAAFEKAYVITEDYFHLEGYMTEEYAASHTAEEFLDIISEGYTRDYALKKSLGLYINEAGELKAVDASGGTDLMAMGCEFFPVDDNTFKAVILMGHEDNPYFVWYEEINFHMAETEEGWRFDVFQTWC